MKPNRRTINAFCDGACKGNPGYGGWGVIAIETTKGEELEYRWIAYGGKKKTTNQEMELQAMFECLRICPFGSDIKIIGDNKTVLQGLIHLGLSGVVERIKPGGPVVFTGWIGNWKAKGWKKADGKPPSHLALWKMVALLCEKHIDSGSTLEFSWTKSHNGDEGNETADQLANLGAAKYAK